MTNNNTQSDLMSPDTDRLTYWSCLTPYGCSRAQVVNVVFGWCTFCQPVL
jgi:hypothetical protein